MDYQAVVVTRTIPRFQAERHEAHLVHGTNRKLAGNFCSE